MKIAFLVQAHTNVAQLALLARALHSARSEVWLHLDAKCSEDPSPLLADAQLVPRIPVYHAGFSQVRATLILLRAAFERGYDHYFLLSGQCFPIKPLDWLFERLDPGHDRLNCYPLPRDILAKRLDRLERFYFERHADSLLHRLGNKIAWRLPKRNFVKGLSLWPYGGSNWWCLRHSTVAYVLRYADTNPGFSRFLSTTLCSDEVFFQSIVSNMAIEHELRPALFCADFDPSTHRPRVYTRADIPLLDAREVFVARKMDLAVDAGLLEHYAGVARG
ncbi:beta-1,6-N-acetylglucosaminyltransferase [Rubrivivax gelatinosus]|uniref:beta-1,6-N-acetylglucosaminyltransferase n=1 Tax=Rubrivivax gelatinosus TaxID=28068 RepID=UPI00190722E2